jgi:hypothetical protein
MRTRFAYLVALISACTPLPMNVSHATAPSGGREWHSCAGFDCPEGFACTKDGCEYCGPGETRCSNGND